MNASDHVEALTRSANVTESVDTTGGGLDETDVDRTDATPRSLARRFASSPRNLVALAFIGFLVFVALFGPLIVQTDPNETNVTDIFAKPGSKYWLGTDELGRDQFTRMVYGTRTALIASVEAVVVALIIALPTGLLAGYRRGLHDTLLSRFNDALMSAPPLILAVTIVAVLGPGLVTAMLAIGIIFSPTLFRLIRASATQVRSETFIEASRSIGCSETRTVVRHVLPNVLPPVFVQVSLLFGTAMLAEASLSFIGLGVRPPTSSWGAMLRSGFNSVTSAEHMLYPPAIMIALTVLAFARVGDGLRTSMSIGRRSDA